MDQTCIDLASICDLSTLIALKEQIKNQVTDNQLTWQERAKLYKMVQLINQRIEQLLYEQVS